jgi:hypothetical protein
MSLLYTLGLQRMMTGILNVHEESCQEIHLKVASTIDYGHFKCTKAITSTIPEKYTYCIGYVWPCTLANGRKYRGSSPLFSVQIFGALRPGELVGYLLNIFEKMGNTPYLKETMQTEMTAWKTALETLKEKQEKAT